MVNVIKIKRRLASVEALSGAPLSGTSDFNAIQPGELFYDEAGSSLYYKNNLNTFKDIFAQPLLTVNTNQTLYAGLGFSSLITLSAGGKFIHLGVPWGNYADGSQTRVNNPVWDPYSLYYFAPWFFPVSTARYVQQYVGWYDGGSFENYTSPSTIAKYWLVYEPYENINWYNLNNWRSSKRGTFAAVLPLSSTNVILSGTQMPLVDLDNPNWVQPKSINSIATGGIQFTSALSATVTCEITGNAIFLNTATYGTL